MISPSFSSALCYMTDWFSILIITQYYVQARTAWLLLAPGETKIARKTELYILPPLFAAEPTLRNTSLCWWRLIKEVTTATVGNNHLCWRKK